jgi:hypothetical protein
MSLIKLIGIRILYAAIPVVIAATAITAQAQSVLPQDVKQTCVVSSKEFNSWFAANSPSKEGWVKPADSVNFPTDNTVCDFYKWGAQMFLWLTSPEEKGLVLDGPTIFNVLPVDKNGNRYLVENKNDVPLQFNLRSEKVDEIGEVGQAGGNGVLMSQGKSLVYYGVHVNNVFGYFLTGQKNNKFPDMTKFPRNKADLGKVETFVASTYPNTPLYASEALTMELKTAWVESSTLKNAGDFIQISAVIPAYTPNSDNTTWTPNKEPKTTQLALVGMHVVGTVQNHPEFVWATFEHISNVPDANYYYVDSNNKQKQQPYSSKGDFVFMVSGGSQTSANVECMTEDSKGNIVATMSKSNPAEPVCQNGIVPSNTARINPWGSAPSDASADNNTLLLSINNSVISQLSSGDLRKNYIQVGGIWTSAPSATADAPIPDTTGFKSSDLRGSLILANSTMETYNQTLHCFTCHEQSKTAKNSFQPFELSHIYSQIVPLPLK